MSPSYILIVCTEAEGEMHFGPFRSPEAAHREQRPCEALGQSLWTEAVELQPGGYLPEWRRIWREDRKAAKR